MDCQIKSEKKLLISKDERLSSLCKAIAHPARLQILRILIREGKCISGDLAFQSPLAPSTVSEHLRILKEAGLVVGTIDGPRRRYCVHQPSLELLKELVQNL